MSNIESEWNLRGFTKLQVDNLIRNAEELIKYSLESRNNNISKERNTNYLIENGINMSIAKVYTNHLEPQFVFPKLFSLWLTLVMVGQLINLVSLFFLDIHSVII